MPKHRPSEYARALYELLEKTPPAQQKTIVKWFAGLLMRKGGAALAPKIMREFAALCDAKSGALQVEVTTVDGKFPAQEVSKSLGKKVQIVVKRDPFIRGGVRIKIGDTLVDNTLTRRMQSLRQAFKGQ
jgi:F-type H+-transporting ATPase subunit delta